MPFNLGPMEMLFVMVVLLLLFGAKRLPELGSGLGKGIREFKRTLRDVETTMADGQTAAPKPPELPRTGAWAHVQPPTHPPTQASAAPGAVATGASGPGGTAARAAEVPAEAGNATTGNATPGDAPPTD